MRLYFFRGGSFQHHDLPPRSRCCPLAIESAIRAMADDSGRISSAIVRIGNEYIPIHHVDEARVVSRMIAADHDCFTGPLYANGFEDTAKPAPAQQVQQDVYVEKEMFKLECEYEQNADLGTPSFGCSKAHAETF